MRNKLLIIGILFGNLSLSAQFTFPDFSSTADAAINHVKDFVPSVHEVGDVLVTGGENIFFSAFDILRFPLGVTQTIVGFPFGAIDTGIYNIKEGISGVGTFVKTVIYLPFDLIGSVFPFFNR